MRRRNNLLMKIFIKAVPPTHISKAYKLPLKEVIETLLSIPTTQSQYFEYFGNLKEMTSEFHISSPHKQNQVIEASAFGLFLFVHKRIKIDQIWKQAIMLGQLLNSYNFKDPFINEQLMNLNPEIQQIILEQLDLQTCQKFTRISNPNLRMQIASAKIKSQEFSLTPLLNHQENPQTPSQIIIRTVGAKESNGIYTFDGQNFHIVTILNFDLTNTQHLMLDDGSLFFCGSQTTCIITPDYKVRQIATLANPRQQFGMVYAEGRIYIFGGIIKQYHNPAVYKGNLTLSSSKYYDIEDDNWVKISDLPSQRICSGAAYYNGNIYIHGGNITNNQGQGQIIRYNISRDQYATTQMVTDFRFSPSILFTVGNIMYCIWANAKLYAFNLDIEECIQCWDIPYFQWDSLMYPVVKGYDVYIPLRVQGQLMKLNLKTRLVTVLGNLY